MRRLLVGLALLVTATIPVAATSVSASHSFEDGAYIITLRDGVSPADVIGDLSIAPAKSTVLDEDDPYFFAVLTGDTAAELSRDSRITDIREEMFARSMEVQTSGPVFNGTQYPMPWGIDRIDSRTGLDVKFTYSNTGEGVRVYVVDSGVNASHPAFGNPSRVVDGWSYRAIPAVLSSYISSYPSACINNPVFNKYVPLAFDRTPPNDPEPDGPEPDNPNPDRNGTIDNGGHGTHVAGTIAGSLTGVAQATTIVPVRVLDSCGRGNEATIVAGLKWIYDQHKQGGAFATTPAVVNLSLGFDGVSIQTETEIQKILSLGIPMVAAAGNGDKDNPAGSACGTTPAGTPGTFSIGASDRFNVEAEYSYFGSCVDMFAPGTGVLSTWPYYKPSSAAAQVNTYVPISGTSMAAPHVAGAVARFLQDKTLSPSLPNAAWEWIKFNATCDAITYHDAARSQQTPNRLLAVEAPAIAPCAPKTVTSVARDRSVAVSWGESFSPHSSAITTYTATASPGGQKCETLMLTCTITGLTNKTSYTISVSVTNAAGTRASASTSTATPEGVPNAVTDLTLTFKLGTLDVAWKQGEGDGAGITYTVTAAPGDITCTTTATSCLLDNLVNGVDYTVGITGKNSIGESVVGSTMVRPDGLPELPASIKTTTSNLAMKFSWPAVTNTLGVTYILTASPGGRTCTTKRTSCTITKLKNGTNYSFSMMTKSPTAKVSASKLVVRARPGFTVKKTTVALRSRTTLGSILTTISKGRKTWSETGTCSIVSGRLVAPRKKTRCVVTLRVARTAKHPAMSTRLAIVVK
jgi:subtilisin family serine protease